MQLSVRTWASRGWSLCIVSTDSEGPTQTKCVGGWVGGKDCSTRVGELQLADWVVQSDSLEGESMMIASMVLPDEL